MKLLKIPFFHQKKNYTCGPASLKMVFDFFGMKFKEEDIARKAKTDKTGTKHDSLINVARKNGFYCYVHENGSINQIGHFIDIDLPVIVDYTEPSDGEGHYAVIIGYDKNKFILNDPWNGKKFHLSFNEFKKRWHDFHKRHVYHCWFLILSKKKFSIGKQYGPL